MIKISKIEEKTDGVIFVCFVENNHKKVKIRFDSLKMYPDIYARKTFDTWDDVIKYIQRREQI